MPLLDLVPIYMSGRRELLARLITALVESMQIEVRIRRPWFDPEISFDTFRGQYNSTQLLRMLLEDPSGSTDYVLGLTSVDLFVPVLTYVFGEAQLDGRAAVVSFHRLQPEMYGLPENESLLLDRLLKESIHELGHCFGLIHCPDSACVMHSSTYVEEIDLKPALFCQTCHPAMPAP